MSFSFAYCVCVCVCCQEELRKEVFLYQLCVILRKTEFILYFNIFSFTLKEIFDSFGTYSDLKLKVQIQIYLFFQIYSPQASNPTFNYTIFLVVFDSISGLLPN